MIDYLTVLDTTNEEGGDTMQPLIIASTLKEPIAYFDSWIDVGRWLKLYATILHNDYCVDGNHIDFKTIYI